MKSRPDHVHPRKREYHLLEPGRAWNVSALKLAYLLLQYPRLE